MNYPRVLTIGLALALLAGVFTAGVTSSAAFGAYNPAWDGTSELRTLADEAGAEATFVRGEEELGDPNDTVALVLAPDGSADGERLRTFAERGGTVVVAADFGGEGNRLLEEVNASARVDGRLLRDERRYYRGPAMPRATNGSASALTEGVDALVLNYGTGVSPGDARVLVRTSPYAYYDTDRDGELDDSESLGRRPVATVESVGDGRVVTVGDPSLFVNAMLERDGNRAFARNLLDGEERLSLVVGENALPPLVAALLTIRGSPLVQALLGFGALGALGLWARTGARGPRESLGARRNSDSDGDDPARNDSG